MKIIQKLRIKECVYPQNYRANWKIDSWYEYPVFHTPVDYFVFVLYTSYIYPSLIYQSMLCLSQYIYIYIYIYLPTPTLWKDMTQGQFLSEV